MNQKNMTAGFKMKPDALYFVPLGGCGMFGANMSLYGYRDKWILVDCGMGFADDTLPGVEILLPDPAFAQSVAGDLLGIFVTHGHEDHIGGLQHLWPRLKAPLYAAPFTIERIRQDFSETPWGGEAKLHEIAAGDTVTLGDFTVDTVNMAHSIPEMMALAITVPAVGTVLHTGDWKFDADPMEGAVTDEEKLAKIGEAGVLAVMGDSTNAIDSGFAGSESTARDGLMDVLSDVKDGMVVVTCFSTNVARLRSIYEAARKAGRKVCLVGRSLWQVEDAARKCGYLKSVPPFLDAEMADMLPVEDVLYVCTGSQAEPRAALNRISNDDHRDVRVADGDTVIFSARAIPGNERAINRMKGRLRAMGVNIITDEDAPVHVSGHPSHDDLEKFYLLTKPDYIVPVHGEKTQQEKHAELAHKFGARETIIPANGDVIEISRSHLRKAGVVHAGLLAIEGKRIVAIDHEAILTRKRIIWNGSAVVTVVVDAKGKPVAPPQITALGLLDEEDKADAKILAEAAEAVIEAMRNMPQDMRRHDDALSEGVRIAARKFFTMRFGRKPQTRVHLVRV